MIIIANSATEASVGLNAELILSILAIFISISSLFVENYMNKKNNMLSIEADIIKTVYDDYLIRKIPESRKKIVFNGNKVIGTIEFIEVLNKIRQDSLFYKYKDNLFYLELKSILQSIEDYVVSNEIMDSEGFKEYEERISKDIESIYNKIINRQMGGKEYGKKFTTYIKTHHVDVFLTTVIVILLIYIYYFL